MRLGPSKENGVVTTAMASAPSSRATSAMTGALPVPVPPPMPAVMKTRSQPRSASATRSRSSSAAFSPISGLAPAPKPLVRWSPIWMRTSARLVASTCASVLAATNSTPLRPVSIMRLTALLPPPPSPMTLMTALSVWLIAMLSRSRVSEEVLEYVPHPVPPAVARVALLLRPPCRGHGGMTLSHAVTYQTDGRGMSGTGDHVGQARDTVRLADPDGETEPLVRHLVDSRHERGSAGDDHVGRQQLQRAHAPFDVALDEVEDLDDARFDDLGQ